MKRIFAVIMLAAAFSLALATAPTRSASARVSVFVSVGYGPPVLPYYPQPICPAYGYIWVPGYWAWGPYGYFWVPGAWAQPPRVGFLWTPGYWFWSAGYYRWRPGYWGPVVGFYGGIRYGYGYPGHGYIGGRWRRGHFYYNRAVTHIDVTNIHNYYSESPRLQHATARVSYNGGEGGVVAHETQAQRRAWTNRHERFGDTTEQTRQHREASRDPAMRFDNNHRVPPNKPQATRNAQQSRHSERPTEYRSAHDNSRGGRERPPKGHGEKHPKCHPNCSLRRS